MKKISVPGILFALFGITILFFGIGFFNISQTRNALLEELSTENGHMINMLVDRLQWNIDAGQDPEEVIKSQSEKIADSMESIGTRKMIFSALYKFEDGILTEITESTVDDENFEPWHHFEFRENVFNNIDEKSHVYIVNHTREDGTKTEVYLTYRWTHNLLLVIGVSERSLTVEPPHSLLISQTIHVIIVSILLLMLLNIYQKDHLRKVVGIDGQ